MTEPGWIPIRFFAGAGEPRVDWCRAADEEFREPFFSQTIERVLRDPFHLVFRRVGPAAELEILEAAGEDAPPRGLVFHVSHCGSTLVAKMLGAGNRHRVLSEPDPLDAVLRFTGADDARRVAWLRGLAAAFRDPTGERDAVFLKLEGPSTLDLPLLRRAFPRTPRVFLYRDPLEVLLANQRAGGSLWSGNVVLARRCGVPPVRDDAGFAARVLARYLETALEDQREPGTLLVRWEELPGAFFERILPHLGIAPTREEEATMREAAGADAKNPGRAFVRDTERKRREAAPEVVAATERYLREPFERLEALRLAQAGRA